MTKISENTRSGGRILQKTQEQNILRTLTKNDLRHGNNIFHHHHHHSMTRFEIDDEGYRRHMAEVKPFRVVQEIVSNSFDEDSVSKIDLTVERLANGIVTVKVIDDGEGFRDIRDAYTMYKHSYKRADRKKIGKFNLGEKQFFVLAQNGHVKSRNRIVKFLNTTRLESDIDYQTGTEVYAEFKWNSNDIKDIVKTMHKLIVPEGKIFTVNKEEVRPLELIKIIKNVALWTEIEDEQRVMRRMKASTDLELYKVKEGETAWLYNLGIPVQKLKHSIEWHVNVKQKIPLGINRDTASEKYLVELYAEILNNAPDLIDKENAGSKWVTVAMSNAKPEIAKHVLKEQFGTDQLFFKSSDHNANESALECGELVNDGMFDRDTRKHLNQLGIIQYAGDVFKTDFAKSERYEPTKKMQDFVTTMERVSVDAVGKKIHFSFVSAPDSTRMAQYGNGRIIFNVSMCGEKFFDDYTEHNIGLVIHELAHVREHAVELSHLTMDYVHEVERIAGIIAVKGINNWVKK